MAPIFESIPFFNFPMSKFPSMFAAPPPWLFFDFLLPPDLCEDAFPTLLLLLRESEPAAELLL